jgi:hypothetical protein
MKSRPYCIGSQTKLRIGTMFFWKMRPSVSRKPSPAVRVCSSSQMRSSDQFSTRSAGSH